MASIREIALKIKAQSRTVGYSVLGEWGVFILVILAVTAAFGLGRLSVLMAPKTLILAQNTASAASAQAGEVGRSKEPILGMFVASKTGAVYYFPWCAGAAKIAPENRRWFTDEKAAEKAGYRAAKNCRGMQTD